MQNVPENKKTFNKSEGLILQALIYFTSDLYKTGSSSQKPEGSNTTFNIRLKKGSSTEGSFWQEPVGYASVLGSSLSVNDRQKQELPKNYPPSKSEGGISEEADLESYLKVKKSLPDWSSAWLSSSKLSLHSPIQEGDSLKSPPFRRLLALPIITPSKGTSFLDRASEGNPASASSNEKSKRKLKAKMRGDNFTTETKYKAAVVLPESLGTSESKKLSLESFFQPKHPRNLYTSYCKMEEIKLVTIAIASASTIRQWAERTLPNGKVVGEVTNANTLHHKTFKPQKGGLFCERIFGPLKDYECACAIKRIPTLLVASNKSSKQDKLNKKVDSLIASEFIKETPSRIKQDSQVNTLEQKSSMESPYLKLSKQPVDSVSLLCNVSISYSEKGEIRASDLLPESSLFKLGPKPLKKLGYSSSNAPLVKATLGANLEEEKIFCAICDVQYTRSIVRRYQLGYIQLVSPAAHVWYLKSNPSYISIVLDMKKKHLEHVTYCVQTATLEHSLNQISHASAWPNQQDLLNSIKKSNGFKLFSSYRQAKKKIMHSYQRVLPSVQQTQLGLGLLARQPLPLPLPRRGGGGGGGKESTLFAESLGTSEGNQTTKTKPVIPLENLIPPAKLGIIPLTGSWLPEIIPWLPYSFSPAASRRQQRNPNRLIAHPSQGVPMVGKGKNKEVSSDPLLWGFKGHILPLRLFKGSFTDSTYNWKKQTILKTKRGSFLQFISETTSLDPSVCKGEMQVKNRIFLKGIKKPVMDRVVVLPLFFRRLKDIKKKKVSLRISESKKLSLPLLDGLYRTPTVVQYKYSYYNHTKIPLNHSKLGGSTESEGFRNASNFNTIKKHSVYTRDSLSKLVNNIYVFSHRELWPDTKQWPILNLFLESSDPCFSSAITIAKRGASFGKATGSLLTPLPGLYPNEATNKAKGGSLSTAVFHKPTAKNESYPNFSLPKNQVRTEKLDPKNDTRKEMGGVSKTEKEKNYTLEDILIPSYSHRFQTIKDTVTISGAGLIEKLLQEFDILQLKKIDKQNRILLYFLNKNIAQLINKLLDKEGETYLKECCKQRALLMRRTKVFRRLYRNQLKVSSMIISLLPVLPPDLRPIIKIGDLMAASDLNRLYQQVIYRNDRLKKFLKDITTSESYEMKYAQRLLQEAVDNLIQNGKSGVAPEIDSKGRLLKSLSDVLKGKQGRFRQYLLGKRVDYSGRSVIVVGPKLKLHQCGIPKEMALELYLPFLLKRILNEKLAQTVLGAKLFIKNNKSFTWQLLREVMQVCPVLLNRAPTLHRLGFQAFQPKLVEGKAILLHPLVCAAFNADFDGDQMAVHVPITVEARAEAWKLMLARNNVLSAATGEPIAIPSQDMVLGCYFLTTYSNNIAIKHLKGSSCYFSNIQDVLKAYNQQLINLHAVIWLKCNSIVEGPQLVPSDSLATTPVLAYSSKSSSETPLSDGKGQKNPSYLLAELAQGNSFTKGSNEIRFLETKASLSFNPAIESRAAVAITKLGIVKPAVPIQILFDSEDSTLEIRLTPQGKRQEINIQYFKTFNCFGFPVSQYIRTTPGRVLFNNIIGEIICGPSGSESGSELVFASPGAPKGTKKTHQKHPLTKDLTLYPFLETLNEWPIQSLHHSSIKKLETLLKKQLGVIEQ